MVLLYIGVQVSSTYKIIYRLLAILYGVTSKIVQQMTVLNGIERVNIVTFHVEAREPPFFMRT